MVNDISKAKAPFILAPERDLQVWYMINFERRHIHTRSLKEDILISIYNQKCRFSFEMFKFLLIYF